MTCRYHDARLVCGECGTHWSRERPPMRTGHDFRPTHRTTVCGVCDQQEAIYHPGPFGHPMSHPFQPVERDVACEVGG